MSPVKTPVVIVDRLGIDLSIHASIEDAQLHLEAVDVKRNEYVAYDSEGRLLALDVIEDKTPLLFGILQTRVERVRIREAEERPMHSSELRSALIRYLASSDLVDPSLESEDMTKLVERVAKVIASASINEA